MSDIMHPVPFGELLVRMTQELKLHGSIFNIHMTNSIMPKAANPSVCSDRAPKPRSDRPQVPTPSLHRTSSPATWSADVSSS